MSMFSTLDMSQETKKKYDGIAIVELEEDAPCDPASLLIYENMAVKSSDDIKHCAFILKKRVFKEEKHAYYYLKKSDSHVTEKYLFSPFQFNHFKKKKQCQELWHGCIKPSLEEIKSHARLLKLQEI